MVKKFYEEKLKSPLHDNSREGRSWFSISIKGGQIISLPASNSLILFPRDS